MPKIDYTDLTSKQVAMVDFALSEPGTDFLSVVGAIRSGKGVGAAAGTISGIHEDCEEHGPGVDHFVAGQTAGSFTANNEEYLRQACERLGYDFRYTTKMGKPQYDVGNGKATIYIYGGSNARSHLAIRGLTAGRGWIDEATLCHPQFIRDAVDRLSYDSSKMIFTTNAGLPGSYFKQEWWDSDNP